MNIRFNIILVIIGVSSICMGCSDHFDSMNIDPNNPRPDAVDPKHQLLFILGHGISYGANWQDIDMAMWSTFCQYSANDQVSVSDYNIDARYVDRIWNLSYTVLINANSLIRLNENKPAHQNVIQMARIWKAYVMLRLTDCIGDIPYSQADNNISQPKYDTQKDIYYIIFDQLKEAANKIDVSAANNVTSYDLIYNGDAVKWKKFANSIRLRMAIRISDVDKAKAKAEAQAAINEGVFTSDADAAYMTMGNSATSQNPIYFHRGANFIHMSTAYKRLVQGIGGEPWPTREDREENPNITEAVIAAKNAPRIVDPRAPIHFEPAGIIEPTTTPSMNGNWDSTDPGHVSSAVGAAMDNGQFVRDFAKIGSWYYGTINRAYPVLKYSELCFLRAIAIELGLIAGDSQADYQAGVQSSMMEFGIPNKVIARYLSSISPNYYGTTANYNDLSGTCNTVLDKILTQKYITQFHESSHETWADHRQFHKPTLMPFASVSPSAFNMNPEDRDNNTPDAYIKRIYYPSSEYTVNEVNVKEAEKRMGGSNSIQNNLWWDVK